MRAITMLNVVLFHCLFGFMKIYDEEKSRLFIDGLPSYLNWVWQVRGSDCLFLVSGFLMGITLIREYQKNSSIDVRRFYKRRFMRIYPLFLVALAIYTMTDFDRNIQYVWANLLFITNFSAEYRNVVPVGWSLAVQMQFYLIVPFIVMMIFATRHRLLLFVLLFVAVVILRYAIVFTHPELNDTTQYSFYLGTATTRLQADLLYYNLHTRFGALRARINSRLHRPHQGCGNHGYDGAFSADKYRRLRGWFWPYVLGQLYRNSHSRRPLL